MKNKWLIAIPLIIVLLGLCVVMVLVMFKTIELIPSAYIDLPFLLPDPFSANVEEQLSFEVEGVSKLVVNNPFGDVVVNTWDENEIRVVVDKQASGSTQQQADKALELVKVTSLREGSQLQINTEVAEMAEEGSVQSSAARINLRLMVPATLALSAESRTGSLIVQGLAADVDLNADFGMIEVSDLRGGAVSLTSRNGSINAWRVQTGGQPFRASSDFGMITLEDLNAGSILVASKSAEVNLNQVEAATETRIESDFGSVNFSNGQMESLVVASRGGQVNLTQLDMGDQVQVSSDFGEIHLQQVWAASYDLRSRNDALVVEGCQGSLTAASDYGEIRISEARQAGVNITAGAGAVWFSGSLAAGPHSIASDFGEIHLSLPVDAKNNLDLQTRFGEIQSDFSITMSGSPDDRHWVGQINGGGELLTVRSQNGSIYLHQWNMEEE